MPSGNEEDTTEALEDSLEKVSSVHPALFQIQKQGKENEYALDGVVAQAAGGNTLSMDSRSPYDHVSSVESSPEYETEHLMTTIGAADPYTNALQHTALLRAQQKVNASVNAGGKSHQHTTPSFDSTVHSHSGKQARRDRRTLDNPSVPVTI